MNLMLCLVFRHLPGGILLYDNCQFIRGSVLSNSTSPREYQATGKITAGWRIFWWRSNVVCYAFFSRSLDVARAESAVDLTCSGARHAWVAKSRWLWPNGPRKMALWSSMILFQQVGSILFQASRKHSTFLDRLKYNYQSARCAKEGP